jgi:hypothetical protein
MQIPSVIDRFAAAVRQKDASLLADLLAPDVALFPSVSHRPFAGKEMTIAVFDMLINIFDSVTYIAEYRSGEGVGLLVRASLRGRDAHGAQFLKFNAEGLIVEFRDFLRPLTALEALRDAATEYMQRPPPQTG